MSRSYHITKKEAAKRFAKGDVGAVVRYAEKRNVKKSHKKYRKTYSVIHPSEKSPDLRNSVTRSSVKRVMKGTNEEFVKEKEFGT